MIHKDGAVEYGYGNRGVAVKVVPVRLLSLSLMIFIDHRDRGVYRLPQLFTLVPPASTDILPLGA